MVRDVATDPLMTPFTMKSLTLRNRIVSTSHEPAYSEDGLPKDRYRAYHVEKAKGGVGLTMIGGSAVVSRGSTPAFGNLQLWKDESVPWLARQPDAVPATGRLLDPRRRPYRLPGRRPAQLRRGTRARDRRCRGAHRGPRPRRQRDRLRQCGQGLDRERCRPRTDDPADG